MEPWGKIEARTFHSAISKYGSTVNGKVSSMTVWLVVKLAVHIDDVSCVVV